MCILQKSTHAVYRIQLGLNIIPLHESFCETLLAVVSFYRHKILVALASLPRLEHVDVLTLPTHMPAAIVPHLSLHSFRH